MADETELTHLQKSRIRMESVIPIVRAMEAELGKERGGDRFDLKVGRGGVADIDFLLQLLQIHHGATRPEWRVAGSRRLLAASPASPSAAGTVRRRRPDR